MGVVGALSGALFGGEVRALGGALFGRALEGGLFGGEVGRAWRRTFRLRGGARLAAHFSAARRARLAAHFSAARGERDWGKERKGIYFRGLAFSGLSCAPGDWGFIKNARNEQK